MHQQTAYFDDSDSHRNDAVLFDLFPKSSPNSSYLVVGP
jgi:hypothetical protein